MARQGRIVMAESAHDVTQRGNYRQDVFVTPEDRSVYLRYRRESAAQNGLEITAYCLMTNHVHLVVVPEHDLSMSRALGRTHLMYAQYIHRLHGRIGHLWQSRFYSNPTDDAHAWNAMAYVELNPLRAGMVRKPWDYPWSSAAAHCGKGADPAGLLSLGRWRDEATPKHWRDTLVAFASQTGHHELLRAACRTGRALGNDTFLSTLEAYLGHRLPRYGRGRPKGSKDAHPRKPRSDNSQSDDKLS